ncbi:MAG: ABC transporter substrate-binding protein [Reyranella sp.]|uniref:ABC transporter substrate-binding protein n=1 Tax=Reyranella sp. TaxID=1929291 RepID=UPI001AD5D7A3|nr:ABC transporter substrate-binding protein [Reyranella sp.]MBN9087749.1 ABC transporter substrate-binding protein [Reyranella sp.]
MNYKAALSIASALAFGAASAQAQDTKVAIAISGWTGFAPLTLAKESGIYARNGLDVSIKKIPQKDRHLAIASGDVQCAATTVETWIVWNANGVATTQLFKMDQGMGSDGIVAKPGIDKVADLKGKTVAASAPGTSPHFFLSWALKKAGMKLADVKLVTLEPAPAASAFVAGNAGLDAAVTYEPYLSQVRNKPDAGKIIVDSLGQPVVFDSFGCTPKFIKENPKAVKALVDSYFQALDMIAADKTKAFGIMGADVKQTAEQFEASQSKLKWADRAGNQKFFAGEIQAFNKEAAALLLEIGVIKQVPANMDSLYDTSFQK